MALHTSALTLGNGIEARGCIALISPGTKVSDTFVVEEEVGDGNKSMLSTEQRALLMMRLLSKQEPAVQIARRVGMSEQTLYRWRDEFLSAGKQAMNGRAMRNEQAKAILRSAGRSLSATRSSAS